LLFALQAVQDNMQKVFTPAGINQEMKRLDGQLRSVQEEAGGSEEDLAFKVRKV
jgi:hypothetical protein